MKHLSTIFTLLLSFCCAFSDAWGKTDKVKTTSSMKTGEKVLVAYFSRTGENYAVGNITKGNTHIVAEMIADVAGGKLFEIVPVKGYPNDYNACVDVAKQEKEQKMLETQLKKIDIRD